MLDSFNTLDHYLTKASPYIIALSLLYIAAHIIAAYK